MNALLQRLSSHFDPIEIPTGFISENDLFDIHSAFVNMKVPLSKKLVETGNDDLNDRFLKIITSMGDPREPGREEESVDKAGPKVLFLLIYYFNIIFYLFIFLNFFFFFILIIAHVNFSIKIFIN
jgi:hypothetical protein